jgi:hypothetical protein
MKTTQWKRADDVRPDLFAYNLIDQDGVLARVTDSTNTFRKVGDYSLMAWSGVTLSGVGSWDDIKTVLIRLFPDHDLADLEIPTRSKPQTTLTRAEHQAQR